MQCYRVGSDQTYRIAKKWFTDFAPQKWRDYYSNWNKGNPTHVGHWPTNMRNDFSSWLWSQGINLVRDNKLYYLEFLNESDASFFILRYVENS